MKRPLLVANWKMHKDQAECRAFVRGLLEAGGVGECAVVLCPPFTALEATGRALVGTGLTLGAQDVHWEEQGAFTGEISVPMLKACGCEYVIVGHSERRRIMGETDGMVQLKFKAAWAGTLTPILCVGETREERQQGNTRQVVGKQLELALAGSRRDAVPPAIVAYEPVWAIGSGVAATAAEAGEMARFIGDELRRRGSPSNQRILYGGSVHPQNIGEFMAQPGIDGALVGGASLDPHVFAALAAAAGRCR
ncbi:MAG TPA: triose-phosphate isomerase [Clostridiales bacterium UBA8153]|nr:triose-phosphate isomerase [Clostridiales bacterium UBA8153]